MLNPINNKTLLFVIGLFFLQPLSGQYITTVAGNGVSACFEDNKLAICTPFAYPSNICIAPNGDIYVPCGNSLKKITASTGIVSRVAGTDTPGSGGDGGPAINALMQYAIAVVIDAVGNLYIAEYGGNKIRKITMSTGIITTIAGTGSAGYSGDGGLAVNAQINQPWELSVDANSNVYIADHLNARVRKVDAATGIITTVAGNGSTSASTGDGGLATNAGIPYPVSICHDNSGNLYISENFGNITSRIRKVNSATGIITTIAGSNLYLHSGDGGLAVNADLLAPTGVHVDPSGNVYISEYVGSRIRKIDAITGIVNTISGTGIDGFGGDGGLAITAILNNPLGLTMDINQDLYISDNQNLRIRKIFLNATTPPSTFPLIYISSPTTSVCGNNPIAFAATVSNIGLNPTYTWKKNGVTVTTNSLTYVGSGLLIGDIITCTLTSTSCAGTLTVTSNSITLTGDATALLSIAITPSKPSICTGENVTFTATPVNGGPIPSYQWKINGNNIGINSSTYNTASLANGDIINCVLTADPAFLCTTSSTAVSGDIIITVNSALSPSINVVASNNNICPDISVSFSATSQNAGTMPSYQWKLNGNNVGNNNMSYTNSKLADNDQVFCIITPNSSCSSSPVISNTISMVVKKLPVIKISPLDTIVFKGSQVQLKAFINGPIRSYSWSPLASLNNPSSLTPRTIPLQNQTEFSFSIITLDNCTSSSKIIIEIQQMLLMPSAFTPNNDGLNDLFRIPKNVLLTLKEFAIYDRWGNKIFSTSDINKGWDGNFKILRKDAGIYIYTIKGYEENKLIFLKGTFTLVR